MKLSILSKVSLVFIFSVLFFGVIDSLHFKKYINQEIIITNKEFVSAHVEYLGKRIVSKNDEYQYSFLINNRKYDFYEDFDKYNINDKIIVTFGLTNYLKRMVFFGVVTNDVK